jgi:hypothetical protein
MATALRRYWRRLTHILAARADRKDKGAAGAIPSTNLFLPLHLYRLIHSLAYCVFGLYHWEKPRIFSRKPRANNNG